MSTVICRRCKKEGTPPEDVTWGGEIGDAIKTSVCGSCWAEWEELSIKIVNEYRLSMANREHFALFTEQLRTFLGLDGDKTDDTDKTDETGTAAGDGDGDGDAKRR